MPLPIKIPLTSSHKKLSQQISRVLKKVSARVKYYIFGAFSILPCYSIILCIYYSMFLLGMFASLRGKSRETALSLLLKTLACICSSTLCHNFRIVYTVNISVYRLLRSCCVQCPRLLGQHYLR